MSASEIRKDLDSIEISYEKGCRKVRCFCNKTISTSIVSHLKREHPKEWQTWGLYFVELRNAGLSSYSIIQKFKTRDNRFLFTSSVVQKEVQKLLEERKAELVVPRKDKIDKWQPDNEDPPRGTLWAFKNRGSWAVHRGDYQGNWSPEIPRFLIKRYSSEKDIVLDPFVGGGTTLIEAWLTNRRGVGLDVNPIAIETANARIREMSDHSRGDPRVSLEEDLRPIVMQCDARQMESNLHDQGIMKDSIRLVCAHPPYLNSLKYTATVEGDLSHISDPLKFCDQLQIVAKQVSNILVEGGICAVLVGDTRKNGQIIPLGFFTLERFLKENFKLKNIIIKAQHRDSSTRFWFTKRDKLDFLIDHEYLLIFEK